MAEAIEEVMTLLEAHDEMAVVKHSYHAKFKTVYEHNGYKDDGLLSDYLGFIQGDLKGWFEGTVRSWKSQSCAEQQNRIIMNLLENPEKYPKMNKYITPEFQQHYKKTAPKVLKELTGKGKRFSPKPRETSSKKKVTEERVVDAERVPKEEDDEDDAGSEVTIESVSERGDRVEELESELAKLRRKYDMLREESRKHEDENKKFRSLLLPYCDAILSEEKTYKPIRDHLLS